MTLMVTDWLGQTDSTTWSFTKAAAALPLVQLVGGAQQGFTISQGISVPVQIFLQSVCAGAAQSKSTLYPWHPITLGRASHPYFIYWQQGTHHISPIHRADTITTQHA